MNLKQLIGIGALVLFSTAIFAAEECPYHSKKNAGDAKEPAVHCSVLLKAGKEMALTDGNPFTWEFAEKVKLGPNILKVTIKDEKGVGLKNYTVKANLDMPSMKGAHSSGFKTLILNKKGDFVIPMDFAMKGEWELVIEVSCKDKPVLNGKYSVKI